MEVRTAVIAAVIALAWFLAGRRHRRLEARRKSLLGQQFRESVRSPRSWDWQGISLKDLSRPYRPEVYAQMLYPPGAWEEVHTPPVDWKVLVRV